ncbi:MAG: DUF2059 domain-containing protein [Thermaurantiacus tibetensis]|uniref:DUF2059 domain-containing protein n=1 Tax=Thermaurantiacus tibetensis TaxID=2759035 RepID=UPI00188FFED8|nr:DUF2059 domain-containing protein [Thermaurantiacus tibetensis]
MTSRTLPVAALAAVLVAPVAVPAPAAAQDATAAATALVDLISPLAQAQQQLEAQLGEMRKGAAVRAMLAGNPRFQMEAAKNQPAFNQGIARIGAMQADAVGPIMREMVPATRKATIAAYAAAFTPAELAAITAFYRTPAGQKLLRLQPQLQAEVNKQMAQQFGARLASAQQALAPKMDAELRKLFPEQAKPK